MDTADNMAIRAGRLVSQPTGIEEPLQRRRRRTRLILPVLSLPFLAGCMTVMTVQHASDPHPGFWWPDKVLSAAATQQKLYLRLGSPSGESLAVVAVERSRLAMDDLQSLQHKLKKKTPPRRLRVHIVQDSDFPADAREIPVRDLKVTTFEELEEAVARWHTASEVWIIRPSGTGLTAWNQPSAHPTRTVPIPPFLA
jgi:hypothetical protein